MLLDEGCMLQSISIKMIFTTSRTLCRVQNLLASYTTLTIPRGEDMLRASEPLGGV